MKQYTFKDGFKCVASTKEEAIAQHKMTAAKSRKKSQVEVPEEIASDVKYFTDAINSSPLFTKVELEVSQDVHILFSSSFGIDINMNDGEGSFYHCMEFDAGPYKVGNKYKWEVWPQPCGSRIWPKLKAHHFDTAKDAFNYCVLCSKEYKKCVDAYKKFEDTIKETTKKLK